MLRLAPSATNAQPWRVLRRDGANHFCLTAWEQGISGTLKVMDAPADTGAPENYRYLFTWTEEQA